MTDIIYGFDSISKPEAILSNWKRTIDHGLLFAILSLLAIGLFLSPTATVPFAEKHGQETFKFVIDHFRNGVLAVAFMFGFSLLKPKGMRRTGIMLFVGAFIALCLTPFLGTDNGKGAVRWLNFGLSIQPSEFVKPSLVIFCAWVISVGMKVPGFPGKWLSLIATVIVVSLLLIQPDYGQSVLIMVTWGLLFFMAGGAIWLLTLMVGAAGTVCVIAFHVSEHFAGRITKFLYGSGDPNGQIERSLDSFKNGGGIGRGFAEGVNKWKMSDVHSDFIIAVAAEEFGILFVFLILGLFVFIYNRALKIVLGSKDPFIRLTGVGLTTIVTAQAFVHIAVAVKLAPAKGLTLPFISYGGSSMLAIGITFGCLLACVRAANDENDLQTGSVA